MILSLDLEKLLCEKLMKVGFSKCERIASGGYGSAYDVGNNKVFKITSDQDEYKRTRDHVVGKDIDGLVHYYGSYNMPKYIGSIFHGWFGLLMDKVETLSGSDIKRFQLARKISIEYFGFLEKKHYTSLQMEYMHDHLDEHTSLINSPLWRFAIQRTDDKRTLKLLTLYVKTSHKLVKQGIIHKDAHGGNVGWDPYGNFVFFDYF